MNSKSLIKMGFIAVGLLLLAGYFNARHSSQETALSGQKDLVPELSTHLNDVKALRIVGGGNSEVVNLRKTEQGWLVANAGNYPADTTKLRNYLQQLSKAKLREAKTAVAASYGKLGVEDVSTSGAKGLQVEIEGLKQPVKLVIGAISGAGGEGAYVRAAGAAQSYLASGQIRPEATLASWVEAEIVNIGPSRVQHVELTAPDGAKLVVRKNLQADSDWMVQDVPKGKELASSSAGNELAGLLDAVRLESVSASTDAEVDVASSRSATARTFDGVQVMIQFWEKEGKGYARLSASLDAAVAAAYADQQAITEASQQKPDAAGKTPAFDAGKFKADRLAALQSEVDAINTRTKGWTYVIAPYKMTLLKRTMPDLYKSAAPANPADPLNLSTPGQ